MQGDLAIVRAHMAEFSTGRRYGVAGILKRSDHPDAYA